MMGSAVGCAQGFGVQLHRDMHLSVTHKNTNLTPTFVWLRIPANSCGDGGEEFSTIGLVLREGVGVLQQQCHRGHTAREVRPNRVVVLVRKRFRHLQSVHCGTAPSSGLEKNQIQAEITP